MSFTSLDGRSHMSCQPQATPTHGAPCKAALSYYHVVVYLYLVFSTIGVCVCLSVKYFYSNFFSNKKVKGKLKYE